MDEWRWRPDQRSGRCGLRANSAPGVSQTCPCIGQSLAFAVQASVTFGGAFFRGATLVLDFDVAFFLGWLAGGVAGLFLARCVGAVWGGHAAQNHAGAQQYYGPSAGRGGGCVG